MRVRVQVKRHVLENVLTGDSETAVRFWQNTVHIQYNKRVRIAGWLVIQPVSNCYRCDYVSHVTSDCDIFSVSSLPLSPLEQ